MIPDFKTYLKESIWTDMQDRGTGTIFKKEDDVDFLGVDKFCEYLKTKYKCKKEPFIIGVSWPSKDTIFMSLYKCMKGDFRLHECFIEYNGEEINVPYYCLINHNCAQSIKRKYKVKIQSYPKKETEAFISPKDGSPVTNRFFIEVLDYILNKLNRYKNDDGECFDDIQVEKIPENVNESIWTDMQDRGSGDMVKREDDINLLDANDFYDYILKRYELLDPDVHINRFVRNYKTETDISTPIYMDKSTLHLSGPIRDSYTFHLNFEMKNSGKKEITMYPTIDSVKYSVDFTISILYKKLCDEFYVYKKHHMGLQMIHIEPKDGGTIDNMFYLKVLDFITDNYDESEHKIIGKA